jgi:hypothetical protein
MMSLRLSWFQAILKKLGLRLGGSFENLLMLDCF